MKIKRSMTWFAYSQRKALFHKLKSASYRILLKYESLKQSGSLSAIIAKRAAPRIILIAAAIVGMIALDDFLISLLSSSSVPARLFGLDAINLDLHLSLALITTGIGVAGVFLALYSANVNSIYTAKYANAPESIAKLFENDIVSNKSVNQISNYLLFSAMFACASIVIQNIGAFSLTVFLLYTISLIVSFGLLGNKRHRLADTYGIADTAHMEILSIFNKATTRGIYSSDINFQAHYQNACSRKLSVLRELAEFNISNKENRNDAMVDYAHRNNATLAAYWKKKAEVPFSSKWFCDKAEYKKWHLASDHEIRLALHTGTSLQQEMVADHYWFEDSIFFTNNLILSELLDKKDWKNLYFFCVGLGELAEAAIWGNAARYYLDYIERMIARVTSFLLSEIVSEKSDPNELLPNVIDALCMVYTSIVLAINKYLSEFDWSKCLTNLLHARNYKEVNIHDGPFANNLRIERLFSGIATENMIEKKRITPDWFIEQVLAYCVFEYIEELVGVLDECINVNTIALGKELLEHKLSLEPMVVFSRATEMKEKIRVSRAVLDELLPFLEGKHRENEYIFPESSYEKFLKNTESTTKALPAYWVKCAGHFAVEHWGDSAGYPDILGQCYNHLCDYLINCLTGFDYESFQATYPPFLRIAQIYQEYIRGDLQNRDFQNMQEALISAITKPITEYATISGFSYLWGELVDDKWKTLVEETSKNVFVHNGGSIEDVFSQWVTLCTLHDERMPAMYNRDLLLSEWETRIAHAIREKNLISYSSHAPFGIETVETESELIRLFFGSSPDYLFMSGAHEVFLTQYINYHLPSEKQYSSRSGWEKRVDINDVK